MASRENLYSVQIAVVKLLHTFTSFSDDIMISEKYSIAIEVKNLIFEKLLIITT